MRVITVSYILVQQCVDKSYQTGDESA